MSALSSLKKASAKKTLSEELTKTAPAPEPEPEVATEAAATEGTEVEIDVEKMTAKELDDLVKTYGIETPAEWKKWKKEQKAAWLNEQFGNAGEEEAAPAEPDTNEALPEATPEPVEPEPKTKPAKGKTVGKGKAVAVSTTKSGEVLSPDEFSNTVAEIENLKPAHAFELVDQLSDASDFTLFKLGGVLSRIHEDSWFKDQGFATFREYIEAKHDIGYRKVMYWIAIYKDLVSSGVPYSAVAAVKWSKLKEIASVISVDNVDEWVKTAKENNIDTLTKLVANYKKAGGNDVTEQLSAPTEGLISTMAFKVHTDQKDNIQAALDKAKAEAKTDANTVALEYICIAFNSNATGKPVKKVPPIKDQLAALDLEAAAQALIDAFPDVALNISVAGDDEEEAAA